jgi:VWFA-related protein
VPEKGNFTPNASHVATTSTTNVVAMRGMTLSLAARRVTEKNALSSSFQNQRLMAVVVEALHIESEGGNSASRHRFCLLLADATFILTSLVNEHRWTAQTIAQITAVRFAAKLKKQRRKRKCIMSRMMSHVAEAGLSALRPQSIEFPLTKMLFYLVVALSVIIDLPHVLEAGKANPADVQRQEQKETDQIRLESPLVTVDAIVTDRHGSFVEGLTPEDFQVFIDGKSRPIVNFSLVRRSAEAARAKSKKPPAVLESQRESAAMGYFLILLDLCFTDQADLRPIADAAKDFVSTQATADDRITIAVFDGSLKVLADSTDKKDQLHSAIDRAVQNIGCKGPHIPSERQALWRDPEVEVLAKMRPLEMPTQVVVGRGEEATTRSIVSLFNRVNEMTAAKATSFLQALLQAVKQLAETPGIRTLIVCSSGFPMVIGSPEILTIGNWGFSTTDLTPYVNAVTAAANVMQVRIFTIDPSGLRPLSSFSDVSISPSQTWRDLSKGGQALQALAHSLYTLHSRNMMAYLAEATSGHLTADTNDLLRGFHAAKETTMAYYSLGVLPLEPRKQGKLHVIRLRVTRPDVRVRYRRNYFDSAPSADVKTLSRMENARLRLIDPEEHLRRAVLHPEIFISVPVRLTGYSYDAATSSLLLNIQIPVVRGQFEFASGGSTLVIYGVLLDPQDKSAVDEFSVTVGLGRRKIRRSIDIQQSVVVKPGRYLLHLVVMEKETEKLGGIRQELRVGM